MHRRPEILRSFGLGLLKSLDPFLELLLIVGRLGQRQRGLGSGLGPFVPCHDLLEVRDSLRQVPRYR